MLQEPTCELLGPISLVLQGALGLIAVLALVLKRKYEHPRRPWKVWTFDVSKQFAGALLLHFLNVGFSILFSEDNEDMDDNPCTWYFLNILFDTTLGIPLLWACLWWVYSLAYHLQVKDIMSGEYGDPPQFRAFATQIALYLTAVILAKTLLYLTLYYVPSLDEFGAYLISWTAFDLRVQIAFVMFIFPTIMNSLQYVVVDSIIQSPEYGEASEHLTPDMRQRLLSLFAKQPAYGEVPSP